MGDTGSTGLLTLLIGLTLQGFRALILGFRVQGLESGVQGSDWVRASRFGLHPGFGGFLSSGFRVRCSVLALNHTGERVVEGCRFMS